MELLSPAGNYKAFLGAVNAGCDAVYLGGSKFGARAYADNFSDEEIIKAIETAHLRNVKVYLTVNTLIKEKEFTEVIDYIKPFYEAGLDACIVQDIGLIGYFNEYFPKMECHVSTQGFALGLNSVKFYKNLGATRVVLARELSLEEIKYIKSNLDIELETFIHGAMCYCYSGECLFSSALGGRSGNRGRCAGPCRLSYEYDNKQSYLLSMKDQCTIEILPKLIEAGIDSLKIEGRMKKPEYTAFVTAIYRKYIDLYKKNPKGYKVDPKDLNDLRHIYLRSQIGEGYYFKKNGKDMLTLKSPSYSGNDEVLMKKINEIYLENENKLPVSSFVYAYTKAELSVTYCYGDEYVTVTGPIVEKASNRPVTSSDIEKQIRKTGDTPFVVNECKVDTDDKSFIPVKVLNDIRRECLTLLKDNLLRKVNDLRTEPRLRTKNVREKNDLKKMPIVSVMNLKQFMAVKSYKDNVHIAVPHDLIDLVESFDDEMILILPDVFRKDNMNFFDNLYDRIISKNIKALYIRNYEELEYLRNKGYRGVFICGPELYSFNRHSASVLEEFFDISVIPFELSKYEIDDLKQPDSILFSYGKLPLMHTANCVYKTAIGCSPFKGDSIIYIKDRMGASLPVSRDCNVCSNTIFNSIPTCLFDESEYLNQYIPLLWFTDEKEEEVKIVLNSFFGQRTMPERFTKAYFNRGVE